MSRKVDQSRENRLKWFGYVMGKRDTKAVIEVMKMNVDGKIGRGKPKKNKQDMNQNVKNASSVCVRDVEDPDK